MIEARRAVRKAGLEFSWLCDRWEAGRNELGRLVKRPPFAGPAGQPAPLPRVPTEMLSVASDEGLDRGVAARMVNAEIRIWNRSRSGE